MGNRGKPAAAGARLLLAGLLLAAAAPSAAQSDAEPELETDRPDQVEAPASVPRGVLQLEFGTLIESKQRGRMLTLPELLVRSGLGSGRELRLVAPAFIHRSGGRRGARSGISDMAVGVKQNLLDNGSLRAAFIAHALLPSGSAGFGASGVDFDFLLPAGYDLGGGWSLSGQLGYFAPAGSSGPAGYSAVLGISHPIGSRWSSFAEYIAEWEKGSTGSGTVHFGAAFRPADDQQWDIHAGIGATRAASDYYVGLGYSVMFR